MTTSSSARVAGARATSSPIRSASSSECVTTTPPTRQPASRVTTTLVRPGSGRPMDSCVFRPITAGLPVVTALKYACSPGMCHGMPPSLPIRRFRSIAIIIATSGRSAGS